MEAEARIVAQRATRLAVPQERVATTAIIIIIAIYMSRRTVVVWLRMLYEGYKEHKRAVTD